MPMSKIGAIVKVLAEVTPGYDTEDAGKTFRPKVKRVLDRKVFRVAIYAIYTGYTYRHEGEIQPGMVDKLQGNSEPNYLGKVRARRVICFKTHDRGRERHALPEDIFVSIYSRGPSGLTEQLTPFPSRACEHADKNKD